MAITSMASTHRTRHDPHESVMYLTMAYDTACTETLSSHFNLLDNPVYKPGLITGIGPHAFQTQGTGVLTSEAFKTTVAPHGRMPVLVCNIIYTPLLSGVAVADMGIHATVTNQGTRFFDPVTNKTLFMGHRINKEIIVRIPLPPYTYEDIAKLNKKVVGEAAALPPHSPTPLALRAAAAMSPEIFAKLCLLHCRLLHPSALIFKRTLELTEGHGIHPSTPLSFYQAVTDTCLVCAIAKGRCNAHRSKTQATTEYIPDDDDTFSQDPVPTPPPTIQPATTKVLIDTHTSPATAPFQHMSTDTMVVNVPSYGDCKYAQLYVDRHSKSDFIYPMKTRNEVPDTARTMHRTAKQHGGQISTLLMDKAGENVGEPMQQALATAGTRPCYTSTADSRANGMAERHIQKIGRAIVVAITQSSGNLPLTAWAELGIAATKIQSFWSNTGNPNQLSAHTLLHGNIPNISYLRMLGSIAIAISAATQVSALQPTGQMGILIGYNKDDTRIYRIRLPNNKVIETPHAKIYEQLPQWGTDPTSAALQRLRIGHQPMAPLPLSDTPPDLSISRLHTPAGPQHPIPRNLRDFIDFDVLQEMVESDDEQEEPSPPPAPPRQRSSRTRGGDSLQQLASS